MLAQQIEQRRAHVERKLMVAGNRSRVAITEQNFG